MPKTYDPNAAYEKWRQRALKRLPSIAARVDALDGKVYNGYGFHYGQYDDLEWLQKTLSEPITFDNSTDKKTQRDRFATQMVVKVRFEYLIKKLNEAEKSAREYEKDKS